MGNNKNIQSLNWKSVSNYATLQPGLRFGLNILNDFSTAQASGAERFAASV